MALSTPLADIGWKALPFRLTGIDGRAHRLERLAGPRGTVVAFISNHCPYVQAVLPRMVRDARDLMAHGVRFVAINVNDTHAHADDGFEGMLRAAAQHDFPFPYLHDAGQTVARAWGAVCTPDFFGLDADLRLQYRGRLDASGRQALNEVDAARELFDAMRLVAHYGHGPGEQHPSMGCSIKWREPAEISRACRSG